MGTGIPKGYGDLQHYPRVTRFDRDRVECKEKIQDGNLFTTKAGSTRESKKMTSKQVWALRTSAPKQPSSPARSFEFHLPVATPENSEDEATKSLKAFNAQRKEYVADEKAERRAKLMQTAGKVIIVIALGTLLLAFMGMTGGFQHAPVLNNPLIGGALGAGVLGGIVGPGLLVKGRNKEKQIDDKKRAISVAQRKKSQGQEDERLARLREVSFDPVSKKKIDDKKRAISDAQTKKSQQKAQRPYELDESNYHVVAPWSTDSPETVPTSLTTSPSTDKPSLVLTNLRDIETNAKALRKLKKFAWQTEDDRLVREYHQDGNLVLRCETLYSRGRYRIYYYNNKGGKIGEESVKGEDNEGVLES